MDEPSYSTGMGHHPVPKEEPESSNTDKTQPKDRKGTQQPDGSPDDLQLEYIEDLVASDV